MTTKVLFIQGGGEGAHAWDAKLAGSLGEKLGHDYVMVYPAMPNEADPSYEAWKPRISKELKAAGDGAVLVAHSIGASMVMKMLAETDVGQRLKGVFLIAAPFVHERDGWQWTEAELPANATSKLPKSLPLFFYHGSADEEVPFSHLALYEKAFPKAVTRALPGRNHQINDDLTEVADDIREFK